MSYADDLAGVARLLGGIARHGSAQLSERDLDIALVARAGVLDMASEVQFRLTGIRPHPAGVTWMAHLESYPTAAFALVLDRYPSVRSDLAPTDALGFEADTDVGHAWQQVARHALSAQQLWTTGSVPSDGPAAWAGLADIASVCAVVSELDAELSDAAARFPGRRQAARRLEAGATSGLRTAARQVCELATAGPLPDRGPEPRPAGNRGLVTITSPPDIATAYDQLANLLCTTGHLRTESFSLIVIGQLRTCRALLDVVPPSQHDLRTALADHAEALAEVTRHPTHIASIAVGEVRLLQQMQVIRTAVNDGSPLLKRLGEEPAEVARLATAMVDTTCAISELADSHVTDGRWLTLQSKGDTDRWAQAASWHSVPGQLQALRAAAVQSQSVTKAAAPHLAPRTVEPPSRAPLSARNLLQPAPFRPLISTRFGARPSHPGQPAVRPVTAHPRRR